MSKYRECESLEVLVVAVNNRSEKKERKSQKKIRSKNQTKKILAQCSATLQFRFFGKASHD